MRKWYIAICVSFLLPIFILFFISLVDEDATRSEKENRVLAGIPKFSVGSLFNGKLSESFENYLSDTFPFREKLLDISGTINKFYAVDLFNAGAVIPIVKDDDWDKGQSIVDEVDESDLANPVTTITSNTTTINTQDSTSSSTSSALHTETTTEMSQPPITSAPLTTGSTSWIWLDHPEGEIPPVVGGEAVEAGSVLVVGTAAMEHYYGVDSSLRYYASTVSKVKELLPGVNVYAMFCPTSIEFNAPTKYQSGTRSQLRAMNVAYSALDVGIIPVDAWSQLYAHKDEYIHFRTDHHWTQRGAYYAYRAFGEAAGFIPHEMSEYTKGSVDGFVGTMYAFTKNHPLSEVLKNNPDTVEIFRPITSPTMTIYRDTTLTNGRSFPLIISDASAEKLHSSAKYMSFIGGDNPICHIVNSELKNGRVLMVTKESYGNALIPFLADHFEEIYVIDPREFNGKDEPSLDIIEFSKAHGVTDFLCVNYAFSASSSFMKIFAQMLP